MNHVQDGLGLSEIEPPIEKGAFVNSPGSASRAPFSSTVSSTVSTRGCAGWHADLDHVLARCKFAARASRRQHLVHVPVGAHALPY